MSPKSSAALTDTPTTAAGTPPLTYADLVQIGDLDHLPLVIVARRALAHAIEVREAAETSFDTNELTIERDHDRLARYKATTIRADLRGQVLEGRANEEQARRHLAAARAEAFPLAQPALRAQHAVTIAAIAVSLKASLDAALVAATVEVVAGGFRLPGPANYGGSMQAVESMSGPLIADLERWLAIADRFSAAYASLPPAPPASS